MPAGADTTVETIESLNSRFTTLSVSALILCYLVLAALDSGMSRVNGDQAAQYLSIIKTAYPESSRAGFGGSWVFGAAFEASEPLPSLPEQPTADQALIELDRLADEWFVIKFDLLGTSIAIDLRLLAPLFPFLMLSGGTYLYILWRTPRVLARSSAADATHRAALVRTRHPQALADAGIGAIALAVIVWAFVLYARAVTLPALDLAIDYIGALICATAYLAAYGDHALTELHHSAGLPAVSTFGRARARIASWWRTLATRGTGHPTAQWFAGAALVLLTLVSSTVVSCGHGPFGDIDRAESGLTFLTSEFNDANISWLGVNDYWISIAMWVLYRVVIAATVVWAARELAVLLMRSPRHQLPRYRLEIAAGRATAVVNDLALMTAVSSVCFRPWSLSAAIPLNAVALAVAVGVVVWIRKRRPHDGSAAAHRWAAILLLLIPPGLTFGLSAAVEIYVFRLIGVPLLVGGLLLQQRTLRAWLGEDTTVGVPVLKGPLSRDDAG
ncbi:MAG: hypothetical protein AB7J63_13365 [Vicinamibacterales bacterium]